MELEETETLIIHSRKPIYGVPISFTIPWTEYEIYSLDFSPTLYILYFLGVDFFNLLYALSAAFCSDSFLVFPWPSATALFSKITSEVNKR